MNDHEIILYQFEKRKVRISDGVKKTRLIHTISISPKLTDRGDDLTLQKTGGRKFALLLDQEVIYWGYLASNLSSLVPHSKVVARISGNVISLDYHSYNAMEDDPRENKKLLDCLKQSKRYKRTRTNHRR